MALDQKIRDQFNKYTHLRVLFFFDPERELEEEVAALQLPDVRVVKYNDQPFNLKVALAGEWSADKIFLYFTTAAPESADELRRFPLLDVLVANKELKLGDVADFMEQYGLRPQHGGLVSHYMAELKWDKVQQTLRPFLNAQGFTKEALERGLISHYLKFGEPQPWEVIIGRLLSWSDAKYTADVGKTLKKIRDLRLEEPITTRFADLFDESIPAPTPPVFVHLLKKLKYNLILLHLEAAKGDPYAALKIRHSGSLTRLSLLFEQLKAHPKLGKEFLTALEAAGQEIREDVLLQHYGTEARYGWMPDSLKWLILNEIAGQIPAEPVRMLSALERFGLHGEENKNIKNVVAGASHAAACLQAIGAVASYRLATPEEYVHHYAEADYKIDQSFRKAISRLSGDEIPDLPPYVNLGNLKEALNRQYDSWLEGWNREWLASLAAKNFDYAGLVLPKQYEFFEKEVAPYEQKLVVFISDALRYEAGIELLNEMHNDRKSEAVMRFMLASVPSKTSVGMSNLLPGKERKFNDDKITVDGLPTASTNRPAVLQRRNPNAVVISYDEVEANNQEKNRELFKAPLVYIYHDVIDATGDARKSERGAFEAVEKAIRQIRQLVKRIHSNYNVARVLITADHGFLYNDRAIADADKEDTPVAEPLIFHNRFAISATPVKPALGYSFPLKATTPFDDERWVVIPASTNRYKKQGVGHQFVHGGATLQELVVPLIESARSREDISTKVGVKLISSNLRIVSNVLKVDFVQEAVVSRSEKGRRIKAGIYSGYDLVSNEEEVPVESTSELPSERVFSIQLKLKPVSINTAALSLKVFDVEDVYNPLIEQMVINNTLIQTDF